jgi:2-phosphoxylose phosphatase
MHAHTKKKIQIDSLVPAYACPAANAVRNAFQAVPGWTDHLRKNASLKARLDAVFGTAGLDAWASWCKVQCVLYIVACSVALIP